NTLIVFLSDNGACDEDIPNLAKSKKIEDMGSEKSFESYKKSWANFSNTPYRFYKKSEYEGGIRTPFILLWPKKIQTSGIVHQVAHINDLMPTFLDIANLEYPEVFNGDSIIPFQGKSLLPILEGGDTFKREPLFWEHEACRAVRSGDWKLVSFAGDEPGYKGEWELYNLAEDPTETINLAHKYPGKVDELEEEWDKWAGNNKVYPLNGMGWNERIKMAESN
ncbi:MAG: sulfatase/phosphatase domain-containing protein, partial [bacterium]